MAIIFSIGVSADRTDRRQILPFESELRGYFRGLSSLKGILPTGLTDLDPYGDTRFEGERLLQLEQQVEGLLSILEPLYRQERLSAELEPPRVVGLERDPAGAPCGRAGALHFLTSLKDLSRQAREKNLPLLALCD